MESYSDSASQELIASVSLSTMDSVSDSEEASILESESISDSVSDFVSESESYSDSTSQHFSDSVSFSASDIISESEEASVSESEEIFITESIFDSSSDEVDSKHLVNLVEVEDNVGEFVDETNPPAALPTEDLENENSWMGQESEEDMQKSASQQLSREFKNVVSGLSGLSSIIHNKGGKNHSIDNNIFE